MEELSLFLEEIVKNSHKCAHCVFCHWYEDHPLCLIAYECIKHDFRCYNEGDEEE